MADRQSTKPDSIISVSGLRFAYATNPSKLILNGLNLKLYPGECLGLRGPNGSGKTTLFRCITGLLKIAEGEIRLYKQIIRSEKDFHNLRCHVGLVLQDADEQLFFPSLIEDLTFGPLNLGLSSKEAAARAKEALEVVGLDNFEKRLSSELSGGEKKLAALAAILAMHPDALLLDEPLNELDENACTRIESVLKKLDCAKIIISHNRQFLENICTGIMLLKDGCLEVCT